MYVFPLKIIYLNVSYTEKKIRALQRSLLTGCPTESECDRQVHHRVVQRDDALILQVSGATNFPDQVPGHLNREEMPQRPFHSAEKMHVFCAV